MSQPNSFVQLEGEADTYSKEVLSAFGQQLEHQADSWMM
jgi:hypothetical protein